MTTRKAYQDLTVADFAGMTPDQIRDVLETYEDEYNWLQLQRVGVKTSIANYLNS